MGCIRTACSRKKEIAVKEKLEDLTYSLRRWLGDQSKVKLAFSLIILIFIAYVLISRSYYSKDYHMAVDAEVELAKHICENSEETITHNTDLLKLDQGDLRNVEVDKEPARLKYIKYPKVMFFKTGIENLTGEDRGDLFCVFSDPRSSSLTYYYDYSKKIWKDNMRFRFRHKI